MSRVIKFRAWQKHHQKMLAVVHLDFDEKPGAVISAQVFNGPRAIPTYNTYSLHNKDWPLDCIELMQFTGLHDKNGVEIYEGDILSLERPEGVGVYQMDDPNIDMRFVAYGEDGAPRLMLMDGRPQGSGLTWCKNNAERCFFVIGNIHQNPELLEGV